MSRVELIRQLKSGPGPYVHSTCSLIKDSAVNECNFQVIFNLRVAIVTLNVKELFLWFVAEVIPMARSHSLCCSQVLFCQAGPNLDYFQKSIQGENTGSKYLGWT